MSLFRHRHRNDHVHSPYSGAPEWAHAMRNELGEMLAVAIAKLEAIQAKLEDRPCRLSPEDQKIMDEIFEAGTATGAELDAATKK